MDEFDVDAYLNHDNIFTLIVKAGDVAVDLISTGVTRMVLTTETGYQVDSAVETGTFDWTTDGASGKVHCAFGFIEDLLAGRYLCRLTIFDPAHTNGQVWDTKFFMNVYNPVVQEVV